MIFNREKNLLIVLVKYCLFVIQLCQRNVQKKATSRTMHKKWMMFFPGNRLPQLRKRKPEKIQSLTL